MSLGSFGGGPTSNTHHGLTSPLYIPFPSKNYSLFKESPKFQLNFNNSQGGNINANFYGHTPSNQEGGQ